MIRKLLILCVLVPSFVLEASAQGHMGGLPPEYLSAAVQGDLTPMLDRIDAPPTDQDESYLSRIRQRFGPRVEPREATTGSALLDDVLNTYHVFWRQCLRGEIDLDEDEKILGDRLRPVLLGHGHRPGVDVLEALPGILEDAGFHVQTGRTRPLQDLFVWRKEDKRDYRVDLSDTTVSVAVHFMADYASPGWIHFATFGVSAAGGWANDKGLFCRIQDYDLESERFINSYLKHEGRHYADYVMFPSLEQTDLEYRAKLTELVYASTSLSKLLRNFSHLAKPNPGSPHALASYAVMAELEQVLEGDPKDHSAREVNMAAKQLLERHTRELRQRGATTITGLIESRYASSVRTTHQS